MIKLPNDYLASWYFTFDRKLVVEKVLHDGPDTYLVTRWEPFSYGHRSKNKVEFSSKGRAYIKRSGRWWYLDECERVNSGWNLY